jgi:mRNA interferase MazF
MVISRGDIVWADFGSARGSEPAMARPALILQEDWLLATGIRTILVVPLTSNTSLEAFPGNVRIPAETSELRKDSVAVVSQVTSLDREYIDPYPVGHLPGYLMASVSSGVRLVLGV